MLDDLPPKCPENLYRKSYGNLKDCVLKGEKIMTVFKLDGTSFKFQKPDVVEKANADGLMEEAAWARYQEGRVSYLTKHLTLAKNNKMNICSKCDQKYYVSGNKEGFCYKDEGKHDAKYDFEKDPENVLNCEI